MKGHVKFFRRAFAWAIYAMEHREKTMLNSVIHLLKRNTIPARNLALAGNFNLVNKDELFSLDQLPSG